MLVLFGILFYLSEIFETEYGIKDLKKGFLLALPLGALLFVIVYCWQGNQR